VLDVNGLPNDIDELKRLVMKHEAAVQAREMKLREKDRQIEHLKLQLAKLRRWKFGQSSEQLESAGQLPLTLEEIEAAVLDAVSATSIVSEGQALGTAPEKIKPIRRKQFPEHFERIDNVIEPKECVCPDCGGALSHLGTPDESEVVEVKTVTFTVRRHIRPKKRCSKCSTIVQAPAPSRPIEKSFAGASLLALVLVWKYGFHLPLYRQCQIFAHAGLQISRTTLMQWVGASSALLGPLVAALAKHVLSSAHLNADDTPIKVLAPGTGKTKRGYLWSYVRDGTAWGSSDPPAVWYQYSPNRKGEHPQRHLATYAGKLQVDAYAGFEALFVPPGPKVPARILEIACWAHVRRGLFDLHEATQSPTAKEALDRIGPLYDLEEEIRGQSADARRAARQLRAVPLLNALHAWMIDTRAQVENKSTLATAFDYALNRWVQLSRYTEDGHLEIDNNIAERSIRGAGIGRKNYLFFGSDSGGERAAIAYSLIETCKLNHIDPQCYLEYVLERIADHPINRIEELLPWNVADQLNQPKQVTEALAA
jgi:transposase